MLLSTFVSCIVILLIQHVQPSKGENPDRTETVRSYKLEFFENGKPYESARTACEARNAWLVEIKDEEIFDALFSLKQHYEIWIGAFYSVGWTWNGEVSLRYANWLSGNPVNVRDIFKNHCGMMEQHGQWKNIDCTKTYRYVCQTDLSYPGSFFLTFVTTLTKTFAEAKSACTAMTAASSRLVEIKTSALNSLINRTISDQTIQYWTSGNDITRESEWKWGDGNAVDKNSINWITSADGKREPGGGTAEDCLATNITGWADEPCTKTNGYICQENITSGECEKEVCSDRGICEISDTRYSCLCDVGYFGTKCEKELITISLSTQSITLYKGQSLTVSLTVKSYGGSVEVSYRKGSESPTDKQITISPVGSSATTELTLGIQLESATYYFDVNPQSESDTYSRTDTISITVIDLCESSPCMGGGTCNYDTSEPYYACSCEPEYDGKTCENCREGTCLNGGGCAIVDGRYYCSCQAGYFGDKCEEDIDECSNSDTNNCDASATCTNNKGSFSCACNFGYIGDGVICEDSDECATAVDNNCHNMATCTNNVGSFTCSCNTGYLGDGIICEDINECDDATINECNDRATCENNDGSYTCVCNSGYTGDEIACTDIDECGTKTDGCDTNADCANTVGSHTCTCKDGFTGDGATCTDIDECEANTDNCDTNAGCTDIPGSFYCICKNGYTGDGGTCTDVDECATAADNNCHDSATCTNNNGSYICTCNSGYSGDGNSCDDINECVTANICHASATCSNNNGSFTCACNTGYTGDGIITCNDIDECDDATINECHDRATCANNGGSYTCVCNSGYTGNGIACTDIDECGTETDSCDTNADCVNTVGSHTCTCKNGFSGDGTSCTDIDECATNHGNCDTNANCTNSPGSYSCACKSGYTGCGTTCTDIDECATATNNNCHANATCTDNDGSYNCACNSGYYGDGSSCDDMDECVTGDNNCHVDASCTNNDGSFTCACNLGYSGNGTTCVDIDECATATDNNCHDSATCSNNVGSFTCACNSGYSGDGITCVDINECVTPNICHSRATCSNNNGSFTCACNTGYSGDGTITCNDSITISPAKHSYTTRALGLVNVNLSISSDDGAVKLEIFKDSERNTILQTKRNVSTTIQLSIGPLPNPTAGTTYVLRATPESAPGSYFRNASVNIIVTDQCTPMLCENSGVCNYETTSPYYSCACIPEYQGQQCEDRKFITNGNCKYHVNSENILNFTTANSTCSNLEGSLAMIKSLYIQDLLENQTIFQYGSIGSSEFWIGGYKSNNAWIWMDGTKIPQTGSNQKWVNTTNDYMMISSLESTRDNMRWFSKANNDFIKGYICEVAVTNPCTAVECMNGGTCVATGCQNNCKCSPGFNGELCQADSIRIFPEKNNYTTHILGTVNVDVSIESDDGAVKIEVYNASQMNTVLQTKRNVSTTIQLSIGPLENSTVGTTYVFRATPESSPGSYFKNTSVNIIVEDQCGSMPCENSGVCNYDTDSPYYSCTCEPEYQGQQCSDRKFIEYGNCKYHVNNMTPVHFTTANSTCLNLNGSLAMTKSSDIQDVIETQIISQYGNNGNITFWIGGYNDSYKWLWMDGTEIPASRPIHKWQGNEGKYLLLSSWQTARDNMYWYSGRSTDETGYVCEVAVQTPCSLLKCENAGTCIATGCQGNCICEPGFSGDLCQTDRIIITLDKTKYTIVQGQSVVVKLNITSNHGPVKVEVFKDGKSVNFTRNDGIYVNITIGPLENQTIGDSYTFQATPASTPGSYYKYARVDITVEGPPTVYIAESNLAIPVYPTSEKIILCKSSGVPQPKPPIWKQNGIEITTSSSSVVRQFEESVNSYLYFGTVARSEVGYYTCYAENIVAGKKVERNATLFVRGTLQLLNKTEHQSESAFESSTFSCTYEGYPAPETEWKWGNGENMTKIRLDETGSIFEIQSVAEITSALNRTTATLTIKLPEYVGRTDLLCCASNKYENVCKGTFRLNEDLILWGNNSYRIHNGTRGRNFSEAHEICNSGGRNLLKISDNRTQTMLSKELEDREIQENVFIGARRRVRQNVSILEWEDGDFLYNETKFFGREVGQTVEGSYSASAEGELNEPENECVVLDHSKQWLWSDSECSSKHGFICESSVAGIPTEFVIDVERCSANISVTWTAATEAIGIKHRIEVSESHSTVRVPAHQNSKVEQFNNLDYDTTYNVKISVCPDCPRPYKIMKTASTYAIIPAANHYVSSATVTRIDKTCVLKWSINSKGIMGFKVAIHSVLAHAASTKYSIQKYSDTYKTSSEKGEHSIVTTPNRIYNFTIQVETCTGLGPPFTAHGYCTSKTEAPLTIPVSIVVPELNDDGTMEIEIRMPDESNGPINCIFVIVIYKPGPSSNSTKYELEDLKSAMAKSTAESLNTNEAYIAIAITRSNIDGNGGFKRNLGDDSESECDVTADVINKRRKRSTSDYNIKANNRKLEDGASYSFFTVTSTPSDGEVYYQTSEMSFFSKPASIFPVGILVGVPVAAGFVLVVCLIVVIFYLKKRRKRKLKISEGFIMEEINGSPENMYANRAKANRQSKPKTAIQMEQLQDTYNTFAKEENAGFQEQFLKLKDEAQNLDYPTEIASNPVMKKKNRYKNIIPSDNTRVILSGRGLSSYINACYVDGFGSPRKFIATQGPLPDTVNDFWRMIVEEKCNVIVMLTRCRENYKVKCEEYWPDLHTIQMFGEICVEYAHEKTYGNYKVRTLVVTHEDQTMTVTQLHFLYWPDHGVPVTTTSLMRYHEAVCQYRTYTPIVVHCSAGAGRTGAFIAYDILSEEAESQSYVDVYSCVMKLRKQRIDMVQNCDQYILVHKLLLEKYIFGRTQVSMKEFADVLSSETTIQREFENLSVIGPIHQTKFGDLPKNRPFNRYKDIIPYERNHITITMRNADTEVPYINASTIETYNPSKKIIAAQGPTKVSVERFWRAMFDSNVNIVVMLTKCFEAKKEQSARYWPEEQEGSLAMNGMTVLVRNETTSERLITREFQVTRDDEEKIIVQYQYVGWNSSENPGNVIDILELIDKMNSNAQRIGEATILVHCSDGAGRTGSFCAILHILDRLKRESKIDVFRTVKDLRDCRPGMVQTMEQYRFIYEAVSAYLTSFHIYSNFEVEEQVQSENVYSNI